MDKNIFFGLLRSLLSMGGGYLVGKGIDMTAGEIEMIAGGLAAGLAVTWSWFFNRKVTKMKEENKELHKNE